MAEELTLAAIGQLRASSAYQDYLVTLQRRDVRHQSEDMLRYLLAERVMLNPTPRPTPMHTFAPDSDISRRMRIIAKAIAEIGCDNVTITNYYRNGDFDVNIVNPSYHRNLIVSGNRRLEAAMDDLLGDILHELNARGDLPYIENDDIHEAELALTIYSTGHYWIEEKHTVTHWETGYNHNAPIPPRP